jgi:hypothetical protein
LFTFGTYYTAAYSEIPIPPNFAAISGKASAQTQAEADHPENGLSWYCEESEGVYEPDRARMPTKACQQHLRFSLLFPNCVNPDDITEYDFSDSTTNSCPSGMKRMPQLRFSARYDTKSVAPNGWDGVAPFQLSCSDTPGEGFCFHGDFINGWFEDAAEDMLVGDGNGRDDGRFISGAHGSSATPDSCIPSDQDPENGTSDYLTSLEMMEGSGVVAIPENSVDAAATPGLVDAVTQIVPSTTPAAPTATPTSPSQKFRAKIASNFVGAGGRRKDC